MGSCISACFGRLLGFTKSWSIKRQMLCFYTLSLVLSLAMIFALTLFNLFYLRERTLQELEESTNSQSSENLRELVTQGAASLGSSFSSVLTMFALIQGILDTREEAQAPEVLPSYAYSDLPASCLQRSALYGEKPVCFEHSSVLQLGAGSDELLATSSRLDYMLPHVLRVHRQVISRVLLYIESETGSILRIFPGCYIPADYNVLTQPWYLALLSSKQDVRGSPPYEDSLGNGQLIVSHARLLRNRQGRVIGVASADTPVSFVNRSSLNISSFETARVLVAALDGSVVQMDGYQPLVLSNLKLENPSFWSTLLANPLGMYDIDVEGDEYMVATSPLGDRTNITKNWWYVIMVLVNKSEVMHDMEPLKADFSKASLWLLLMTAGCSVFTAASVLICILMLERQITRPLKGIVEFSKKISENAANEEAALSEELEDLQEGQSQVASLVVVFKSLMRSLLDTRERPAAAQSQTVLYYSYPLNHLYDGGITWKGQLSLLNKS